VVATPDRPTVQVVEIPLNRIKVTTRLRGTDPKKVTDIAEAQPFKSSKKYGSPLSLTTFKLLQNVTHLFHLFHYF